jgi:hypothetical protein
VTNQGLPFPTIELYEDQACSLWWKVLPNLPDEHAGASQNCTGSFTSHPFLFEMKVCVQKKLCKMPQESAKQIWSVADVGISRHRASLRLGSRGSLGNFHG